MPLEAEASQTPPEPRQIVLDERTQKSLTESLLHPKNRAEGFGLAASIIEYPAGTAKTGAAHVELILHAQDVMKESPRSSVGSISSQRPVFCIPSLVVHDPYKPIDEQAALVVFARPEDRSAHFETGTDEAIRYANNMIEAVGGTKFIPEMGH